MAKRILAFDFGASSGRAVISRLDNGKITIDEIHRFSNDPVIVNGTMYWDILRLWFEIKQGIIKAVNSGGFDAISIDTWGVDFGVIDKRGQLIGNPVHYRDRRTNDVPEKVYKIVPKNKIYERTGIQHMHFNTLYQLKFLVDNEPEILENADKILMIPDLFAYFLTGQMRGEITNLSTTNLFNPNTLDWDYETCEALGINKNIFPKTIKAGETYGNILPEICEELGCQSVPVIATATHDTAAAIAACPAPDEDFAYISCGTWSLFGTESKNPIINDATNAVNFTNEIGYGNNICFLKNIMGLWIIQESRRQWKREGMDVSFAELETEAKKAKPFMCYIDVDASEFETAGNMPKRICEYCEKTGQYVPKNRGEIMICIYQSLAMKYKHTFINIENITGKKFNSLHMIGGGIKDKFLCGMTASACDVNVIAGPVEATATGNAAVAFLGMGLIDSLKNAREIIGNSVEKDEYTPHNSDLWNDKYKDFLKIINTEE